MVAIKTHLYLVPLLEASLNRDHELPRSFYIVSVFYHTPTLVNILNNYLRLSF